MSSDKVGAEPCIEPSGDLKMADVLGIVQNMQRQLDELKKIIKNYQEDATKLYKIVYFKSNVMGWDPNLVSEKGNIYMILNSFDAFVNCYIENYDYLRCRLVITLNEYASDILDCLEMVAKILKKLK
jgi:hypothetical protein